MHRNPLAPLLGLALALVVSSCSRTGAPTDPNGSSTSADEVEVTATLAAAPEVVGESVFETGEPANASASSMFANDALAAIRPVTFWRRITEVDRRFTFAFSDTDSTGRPTRAVVTVYRTLRGTFNILADPPATDPAAARDTTRKVVHKRLLDHAVRRILLVRVNEPWRARASWRVAATSGVSIVSDPRDDAPEIKNVRVEAANLDTTITDPLSFWRLRRILKLDAGRRVRVTVTTGSPEDLVFLLRIGYRVALLNRGDGTHVGEFVIGDEAGLRHVAINALAHDTLFDDEAPYQSRAWVLPYVVRAEELVAEYRPAE